MKLTLPDLSLIVLIGPSGSGKSSFAARHFKSTEIVSSDECRGMISDDPNDQAVTNQAFELMRTIISHRLKLGRLTVVDATNLESHHRKQWIALAREFHVIPSALVFKLKAEICIERNRQRPDRDFGGRVVTRQISLMRQGLRKLRDEGFRHLHFFETEEEVNAAEIAREPLWNNRKHESGPFDIIGDVHGCYDELVQLLEKLGYRQRGESLEAPAGRRLVFVGDLTDRGPKSPGVLRLVMRACADGVALCVPGNHDDKLKRKLQGKNVQLKHGLEETMRQLEGEPPQFTRQIVDFIDGLVSHYVFDGGKLVVAHAGMKEEMQGRGSGQVRGFALYGETTGETDEFGLPERLDWARDYRGQALVVHGHTPVAQPRWLNRSVNIDNGCVFGGQLTALRYPELETVSVPALAEYAKPARPLQATSDLTDQQAADSLLEMEDVRGKRAIDTALIPMITIQEENAMAALEVMSRFAVDPKWLVYLPPTMSPSETSHRDGYLEHPDEAFAYFQKRHVRSVVCEEKHMGSRAVVVVCRDAAAARKRFGVTDGKAGVCYTRTGRPFFQDGQLEAELIAKIRAALTKANFWDEFQTSWFVLDAELLPWSLKARELLVEQYAPAGAAGEAFVAAAADLLEKAVAPELAELKARLASRGEAIRRYREAYRRYCWDVDGLEKVWLAPFHLLTSEGAVHTDKTHVWHMTTLARLAAADPDTFRPTQWRQVDLSDPKAVEDATAWWEQFTESGGEGMVVKPLDFITKSGRDLVQPGLKCRGREYLRIIYGAEYDREENLTRLRERSLRAKRSLAARELALGLEALQRFVKGEPLRKVHECVFGVLALESEPVDPRL